MAKRSDGSALIAVLDQIANPIFWKVLRERVREKEKNDGLATDWFAAANEGRFNPETCRQYAKQHQRHAETYWTLAVDDFEKCNNAVRLLAEVHPELLGDFPVLDWDIANSLRPVKMAQRLRKLLGRVLRLQNRVDTKTDKSKKTLAHTPRNDDVAKLALIIRREYRSGEITKKQIAEKFTKGNTKQAESLLRQLRGDRYKILLAGSEG